MLGRGKNLPRQHRCTPVSVLRQPTNENPEQRIQFRARCQITFADIGQFLQTNEPAMCFGQHGLVEAFPPAKMIIDRCKVDSSLRGNGLVRSFRKAPFSEQHSRVFENARPGSRAISPGRTLRFSHPKNPHRAATSAVEL